MFIGFVCSSQEGIVERLFKWAQEAEQPLRIYATGLLAGAMENQDIAANYREENSVLVRKEILLLNVNECESNHRVFPQVIILSTHRLPEHTFSGKGYNGNLTKAPFLLSELGFQTLKPCFFHHKLCYLIFFNTESCENNRKVCFTTNITPLINDFCIS